jgi:hypothetical protein
MCTLEEESPSHLRWSHVNIKFATHQQPNRRCKPCVCLHHLWRLPLDNERTAIHQQIFRDLIQYEIQCQYQISILHCFISSQFFKLLKYLIKFGFNVYIDFMCIKQLSMAASTLLKSL